MAKPRKVFSILGYFLFFLGSLIGLFVVGSAAWGDLEAAMLARPMGAERGLSNLHCPVFVSTGEIGEAYVWISNNTDKAINRTIRTHLSNYHITLTDTVDTKVSLEPGEKKRVVWPVNPEDALYGRFYIIRVYLFSSYKTTSQEGSCGIMVIDLPLSGKQIEIFSILLCAFNMGLGYLLLRIKGSRGWDTRDKIQGFMIILVATGLVFSFLGGWFVGFMIILLFVLLVGSNLVRLYT
jgi:hypothetical protein